MNAMNWLVPFIAILLVVGVGCTQGSSASSATPGGSPAEWLPGPLPGWEKEFDGVKCRHPPVQAECRDGWCRVPRGCFIMGSPPDELGHPAYEEDQRAVTLTRDMWVQQYEVSQEQWMALGLNN